MQTVLSEGGLLGNRTESEKNPGGRGGTATSRSPGGSPMDHGEGSGFCRSTAIFDSDRLQEQVARLSAELAHCKETLDELQIGTQASTRKKDAEIWELKCMLRKQLENEGLDVKTFLAEQAETETKSREKASADRDVDMHWAEGGAQTAGLRKSARHLLPISQVGGSRNHSSDTGTRMRSGGRGSSATVRDSEDCSRDFLYIAKIEELQATITQLEISHRKRGVAEKLIERYFKETVGCGWMAGRLNNSMQSLVETILRENQRLLRELRRRSLADSGDD